ncbi:MAG: transposase [Sulfitobacter sp.]
MSDRDLTYFFTARLSDPNSDLLTREVSQLRDAMRATQQRYPFHINAIVILPNAIHTLWTVPEKDTQIRQRWSMLKSHFSRRLPPAYFQTRAQVERSDKHIWHRSIWQHLITDSADLATHRQVIHSAPVQAGLVDQAQDWSWTSLHRDIANRTLAANPEPPVGFS